MDCPGSVTHYLRSMQQAGVFLDPLLANNYLSKTDTPRANYLRKRARDMADTLYHEWVDVDSLQTDQLTPDRPFSPSLLRLSLHETLIATAVAIAHEDSGLADPDEGTLVRAQTRVCSLLADVGALALYDLYFVIAGYDSMQPLYFHKDISEKEYLSGIRHHPYHPENLELFLLIGLATRNLRLKTAAGARMVHLTRRGTELFEAYRDVLRASGYFDKRVQFAYLYQFDTVQGWDQLCHVVWPNLDQERNHFLDFVGSLDGQRVLEVASGTGALTFDAGLYRRIGASGTLVAFDLSSGMLDQARRKWRALGQPRQVQFQLGTVEKMPFLDESFDACLGCAFLHFVDPVAALREMARTVVPGGIVSVYQGSDFSLDVPFFREWFEPVFALARRRNAERPRSYLPNSPEVIAGWFVEAGLDHVEMKSSTLDWHFDNPEVVVQHIVRGVSFFESELMELPWDDRRAVVAELVDRGHDVCARYPLKNRVITLPVHSVKGRVPLRA